MAYDVAKAFKRIEDELIDSMMRNLGRHNAEEALEGFDWTQWQVEQLRSLEEYRKNNQEKYGPEFKKINERIGKSIERMGAKGENEQEKEILRAIDKGHVPPIKREGNLEGTFFGVNNRKLDALLDATQNDFQKAEIAVLRRADDQYRRIIFDAQVYANTGAATYGKAIDMATKDFLMRGIDCIEYKNGARHTISDYADMYVKTAQTRAYLAGEGKMREEWGEHYVIVNKRGDVTCPKCAKWVGRVLIDDVYSGGKPDGKTPLLSTAMADGFLHPRCKDIFTTYFPGISTPPEPATKKEIRKAERAEKAEARQDLEERQADKFDRRAKYQFDQNDRMMSRHRANQWKELRAPFVPAKTIEEAQEYASRFCKKPIWSKTFDGAANYKGISIEHANAINRAMTEVYDRFPELDKLSGIKTVSPKSAQGKKAFPGGEDALFSYSPVEHGIFINKDLLKNPKVLDEYMERSREAWETVMENIDRLSGANKELALKYKEAGRDLVSGDTVEGLFTHELGHHVQWTMLDPKATNSITERMKVYAPHLSGYANASKSEYLAESFTAYMKGETDLLDPEYVKFLDGTLKGRTAVIRLGDSPEPVMGFKAVSESNAVKTMREEYSSWAEMLTKKERHAIRKYSKNSLEERTSEKFFNRLNAMLRGDIPEDSYLRGYANTISKALRRKPLENDMLLYRNLSVDPFAGIPVGNTAPGKQFFSTSVIRSRAMKGDYHITIIAPKGTPGAYIESISRVPNQREFLIDKGCQYRVVSRKGKDIVLEVVI